MDVDPPPKVERLQDRKHFVVGSDIIHPSEVVRNLGAFLDREMTMNDQISHTIKSSYFHLRRISKVRRHLDQETCTKVVHSSVTSRLDYHNALLTAIPDSKLKKLQLVQNNAARLIVRKRRDHHITPVLYELHWLPIKFRIRYKILSLVHQAIHDECSPQYTRDHFQKYQPPRNLRSSDKLCTLTVKR